MFSNVATTVFYETNQELVGWMQSIKEEYPDPFCMKFVSQGDTYTEALQIIINNAGYYHVDMDPKILVEIKKIAKIHDEQGMPFGGKVYVGLITGVEH